MPAPLPAVPVTVRPATPDDLPFVDALQKRHGRAVGWMPTASLLGKIAAGQVLVAEAVTGYSLLVTRGRAPEVEGPASNEEQVTSNPRERVGYLISSDRYFKRDDVGVVYQMNVVPAAQRGLVGATLLKAAFDRAAYGCKLFCCWCAQDLAANRFWEAMGFVPLAFRTGGRGKAGDPKAVTRTHIFWQRRIRAGDVTTPYWYPSQTGGGSIREDRLVLPIPPGVHWRDAMPELLPAGAAAGEKGEGGRMKEEGGTGRADGPRAKARKASASASSLVVPPSPARSRPALGGLRFGRPAAPTPASVPSPAPAPVARPQPERAAKRKNDPALVAAARELRDRYLERFNDATADGAALPAGKYDVSRTLPTAGTPAAAPLDVRPIPLLPAA